MESNKNSYFLNPKVVEVKNCKVADYPCGLPNGKQWDEISQTSIILNLIRNDYSFVSKDLSKRFDEILSEKRKLRDLLITFDNCLLVMPPKKRSLMIYEDLKEALITECDKLGFNFFRLIMVSLKPENGGIFIHYRNNVIPDDLAASCVHTEVVNFMKKYMDKVRLKYGYKIMLYSGRDDEGLSRQALNVSGSRLQLHWNNPSDESVDFLFKFNMARHDLQTLDSDLGVVEDKKLKRFKI